jgi:hypothetical protein
MTSRWVTAIVYAAAAVAVADQLSCCREFGFGVGGLPLAKFAVAGCAVLGFASLLLLFELRYGLVLGLVGEGLCWLCIGRLAFVFPWRHIFDLVSTEICGWPDAIAIFGLVAATLSSLVPPRPEREKEGSFKHLRIVRPIVQVLIVITFFTLKLRHALPLEAYRLHRLIMTEVNYPVFTVWVAIAAVMEWLSPFLPNLTGWPKFGAGSLLVGLFVSSLVLFWYFAVGEVELRQQGRSRLRFSGAFKKSIVIGVFFLFGAGALVVAYITQFDPSPHCRTSATPFEVAIYQGDFYFRRLILVVWALLFLRLALYDLILLVESRAHHRLPTAPDR